AVEARTCRLDVRKGWCRGSLPHDEARRSWRDGRVHGKDAGSAASGTSGATEDAAGRRPGRQCDSALIVGQAPIVAANAEHLLQDLSDCAQRVELPPLYLVEQPPQLGIVRDRVLEMLLCPRRGDGEHFTRKVAGPPLLELP